MPPSSQEWHAAQAQWCEAFPGNCTWGPTGASSLSGLVEFIQTSQLVELGKNLAVGAAAIGAAAVFCGATGLIGCVLIVGASAGAVVNLTTEVGIACADGCSSSEVSEVATGAALEGAVRGGGAALAGHVTANALGIERASAGLITVARTNGVAAVPEVIALTVPERTAASMAGFIAREVTEGG